MISGRIIKAVKMVVKVVTKDSREVRKMQRSSKTPRKALSTRSICSQSWKIVQM